MYTNKNFKCIFNKICGEEKTFTFSSKYYKNDINKINEK